MLEFDSSQARLDDALSARSAGSKSTSSLVDNPVVNALHRVSFFRSGVWASVSVLTKTLLRDLPNFV